MNSDHSIDPAEGQFAAFMHLPQNTPIHMLNLIRLRADANYPEDHPCHGKGMSGRDAYRAYAEAARAVFGRVGGREIWAGRPEAVLIGPRTEHWDIAFIAEYPNALAFADMVRDPEYREHVKHRQAAVADSRLIRFFPLSTGNFFGEKENP